MTTPFTEQDLAAIEQREIPVAEAVRQFELLKSGASFIRLERPCTPGDGILRLTPEENTDLLVAFDEAVSRFTRFVPASGAASRMFAGLFPDNFDSDRINQLRHNLESFPFYPVLCRVAEKPLFELDDEQLVTLLLTESGLGLAGKPKGLLPLHRGEGYNRTAFAEHLHEGGALNINRFHFTVSPEHRAMFDQQLQQVTGELGKSPEVGFSIQHPQTDTIALDLESGLPLHDEAGNLVFRPAGHGALLTNLEQCDGDLVLIRNIDNVAPEHLQSPYRDWTRLLGGLLVDTQKQVFHWLELLDQAPGAEELAAAATFTEQTFGRRVDENVLGEQLIDQLRHLLDRPIRICGMVPVSGHPGGGPFWTGDAVGQVSPQIIEGVQIDPDDEQQQELLAASTHFNPVNIACSLRDRHGKPYRLQEMVDEKTSLVTGKSLGGRDLLALERPGLWNGSMSGWNTIFIELPDATFNPVKTVFDLLQPSHRPL